MTIEIYEKLPIQVPAVQWTGDNYEEVKEFAKPVDVRISTSGKLIIYTLEGWMDSEISDMIIKGVKDEVYPCKLEIFNLTYRKIENTQGE